MENKEKSLRKKSLDLKNLPQAPPLPENNSKKRSENDPFYPLYTYKEREMAFLRSLSENIKAYDNENKDQSESDKNNNKCEIECHSYMMPLLNRTNCAVSTALATKDSIDQLDKLYDLVKQLLTIQEQNFRMRKSIKTVEVLQNLKTMDIQVSTSSGGFL